MSPIASAIDETPEVPDTTRPASETSARIHRADQPPVVCDIDRHQLVPGIGLDMDSGERRPRLPALPTSTSTGGSRSSGASAHPVDAS